MKENDFKKLPPLSIPIAGLRLSKDEEGKLKVFDILRNRFVALTPEEWVRQNFIHWLIDQKQYPASLISNEIEIKLNDTKKRCDTIVFSRQCQPLVIIEYKAPGVEITQATFEQIVRYNMKLKAQYLIVTNGLQSYCCKIDYLRDSYHFIKKIPTYPEISGLPGEN